MDYALKILTQLNVWYDGLDKKWKTALYILSILAALLSVPLGVAWLALIFFAGIGISRVWYILITPKM